MKGTSFVMILIFNSIAKCKYSKRPIFFILEAFAETSKRSLHLARIAVPDPKQLRRNQSKDETLVKQTIYQKAKEKVNEFTSKPKNEPVWRP